MEGVCTTPSPAEELRADAVGSLLPASWGLPGEVSVGDTFSTSLKTGEDISGLVGSCWQACIRASAGALGLRSGSAGVLERPLEFLHRRAGGCGGEAACGSPRASFPGAVIREVLADLRGSGTVPMEFLFRNTSEFSLELLSCWEAVAAQSEATVRHQAACSRPALSGAAGPMPALWQGLPVAYPRRWLSAPHRWLWRARELRSFSSPVPE